MSFPDEDYDRREDERRDRDPEDEAQTPWEVAEVLRSRQEAEPGGTRE